MLTIELSTVHFYRGETPQEILLRSSSLPLANAPSTVFCALYGTQGKQDGFVAARTYALTHGLGFTVIDVIVDLEAQNPLVMKPEDLARFDFLNFSRVSRALGNATSEQLARIVPDLSSDQRQALRTEPLRAVLSRWPSLIDILVRMDGWRHLKVIAFQAPLFIGSRPVSLGSIPKAHWSAIREATCRLNPNIHVRLDPPE